ncbi:MAG: helix-turn-helix domain-containing protein [Pseudomonadota bacterium]
MQEHLIFQHILNIYDAMLLMTTVLAVLLSLPLLLKRDRHRSDVLLAAFLMSQGLLLFMTVMYYSALIGPITAKLMYPFQSIPKIILTGSQGLLLLWFARAMMGKPLDINSKLTWFGVIFGMLFCILSLAVLLFPPEYAWISSYCFWGLAFYSVLTGVYALKLMGQYDKSLQLRYSNIEKRSLAWLRWTAGGLVFVWALRLVASILYSFDVKTISDALSIFSNVPPVFLLATMVVYSQTHAINASANRHNSTGKSEKDDDAGLVADDEPAVYVNTKHTNQLEDLMIRVKVYQDPELRLEGLADSMDISPRTLSSLLNRHYQKNFYDYVNYYRVMDAQDQLVNVKYQDKPIQRIFEDAGFNSKSTFNTLFKKYTGQTPSEFRKRSMQKGVESS